ncbi:MAG: hypothetical protein IKB44_04430 [Clostridia bacterium]|nr:hypothetical protein [Clostridia bacterium]MBR2473177.1 hypothetical protein [Clostridia bacterium]
MKNKTKMIIAIVLVIWIAIGVLNYFEAKNMKKPSLTFKGPVDTEGNITYLGVGYSFIVKETDGEITYIEMYACGLKIVSKGER